MSNDVKISMDRVYRTRDGREVRIYAVDGGGAYPVHGAIRTNEKWDAHQWPDDGQWCENAKWDKDLIEVKPRHKRTVWLTVSRNPNSNVQTSETREDADRLAYGFDRIACIKVDLDFEEGEGL